MNRKRKRDWPIRVLRYRAYPTEIPQQVWDAAKKQRTLWNQLVELWRGAANMAGLLPEKKKEVWQQFDAWARALVVQSGLDWVNGPDVYDRFRATTATRHVPRFHGGLVRICLSHRFTGGGLKLAQTVDNFRSQRFALRSSPSWQPVRKVHSPKRRHWRGIFSVDGATIDFALALHRPLPPDAILKRAAWVGERAAGKWFWYLALTIEEPPVEIPASDVKRPWAGIDMGWRLFADGTKQDYVRAGMLSDSDGRMIELRLPLMLRPRRFKERRGLATLADWQREASELIEQGKTIVRSFPFPADDASAAQSPRLGKYGLSRLLTHMDGDEAAVLRNLLDKYDAVYRRISHLRFRLIQRRRWYYQNLALWLCRRYSTIAIEGDLKLQDLQRKSDDPALRNSAQYRNYAAVGEFRACLRRAAQKTGTSLVESEARNTTVTCWYCGISAPKVANVELMCPNGHRWDQDGNASRNILAQATGTFGQPHTLGKSWVAGKWKRLSVPATVSAIAVEVPAR